MTISTILEGLHQPILIAICKMRQLARSQIILIENRRYLQVAVNIQPLAKSGDRESF